MRKKETSIITRGNGEIPAELPWPNGTPRGRGGNSLGKESSEEGVRRPSQTRVWEKKKKTRTPKVVWGGVPYKMGGKGTITKEERARKLGKTPGAIYRFCFQKCGAGKVQSGRSAGSDKGRRGGNTGKT